MNADRRKRLNEAESLALKAKDIVDEVMGEEQDAYDNMPESFQNGEKGEKMTECIGEMESFSEAMDGFAWDAMRGES